MATPKSTRTTLLERRQSYERIPRFFFPRGDVDGAVVEQSRALCRQRALARIDERLLSPRELQRVTDAVCEFAYVPKLSGFQKVLLKKTAVPSGVVVVDHLLADHKLVPLSYNDWLAVLQKANSAKAKAMLSAEVFLTLPKDENGKVNGHTVLEFLYQLHRSLVAARFLLEQPEGSGNGLLTDNELTAIIQRRISSATMSEQILQVDPDFQSYYELICTRMIVLRHDFKAARCGVSIDDVLACPVFLEWLQLLDPRLHEHYVTEPNRFRPEAIRHIHRQYIQLDRDKNGMISADELMDYGKKKAFNPIELTPTHDLTVAFVNQVFAETMTYPPDNEMAYRAYIDFTLLMADRTSLASLRFFWSLLDIQKQGHLDAFTLDVFLRDLVVKIREHRPDKEQGTSEELVEAVTRLRTQVFDLVGPRDPLRITWRDLTASKLGHLVVRLLSDFVAYEAYEACDGRFRVST